MRLRLRNRCSIRLYLSVGIERHRGCAKRQPRSFIMILFRFSAPSPTSFSRVCPSASVFGQSVIPGSYTTQLDDEPRVLTARRLVVALC